MLPVPVLPLRLRIAVGGQGPIVLHCALAVAASHLILQLLFFVVLATVDGHISALLPLPSPCLPFPSLRFPALPSFQPPVASNSFGAGHAGVAYDVELMQQGWLEARGADSAIFEQVSELFPIFYVRYRIHVK